MTSSWSSQMDTNWATSAFAKGRGAAGPSGVAFEDVIGRAYRRVRVGGSVSGMTRVAILQVKVDATEPVNDRIAQVLHATEQTADQADLVILPELWPTGAFDLALGVEHAQAINGPLATALGRIAATTGTWIHGGSFVEASPDGGFFNTSVLFDASGELAASYRKIHLFGFDVGEAAILKAGDQVVVVDTPLGRTALATCYDLRFPELFRRFVDEGATAVLLTSGWPDRRISRWLTLAAARSCENQMWLVGCNETGFHGGHQLGGRSIVCDPWGDAVVTSDSLAEDVIFVDLDPTVPDRVRVEFPVLRDRRLR
jgi:predicted amidohydrolase